MRITKDAHGLVGLVQVLKENLRPLAKEDQAKVLGDNALHLYNLS